MNPMENRILGLVWMVFIFLSLSLGFSPDLAGREKHKKLYTAYNIWYEKPHNLRFINYKIGKLLPAGTELDIPGKWGDENPTRGDNSISFKAQGISFSLSFDYSFYLNQTLNSIFAKLFTSKNFLELTADMSEKEADGVKRGTPIVGMTKEEVLIAFGYPPEHRTKSLKLNRWTYWRTRTVYFYICFDEKELVRHCHTPDDIWRG